MPIDLRDLGRPDIRDHESTGVGVHGVTKVFDEADYTPEDDTHDRYSDSEATSAVETYHDNNSTDGEALTIIDGDITSVPVQEILSTQEFTSVGTPTANVDVSEINQNVRLTARGGGGADGEDRIGNGGLGGAGGHATSVVDISPYDSIDIYVGQGTSGTGGGSGYSNGSSGSNTSAGNGGGGGGSSAVVGIDSSGSETLLVHGGGGGGAGGGANDTFDGGDGGNGGGPGGSGGEGGESGEDLFGTNASDGEGSVITHGGQIIGGGANRTNDGKVIIF